MSLQLVHPQGHSIALHDNALSGSLLLALERRYLYGVPYLGLRPVRPDPDLMAEVRFLQILDVAHGADIARSLHVLNMQNVLSSFRDGAHSVLFVLAGRGGRASLFLGLYKSDAGSAVQTADYIATLQAALGGNYPGIRMAPLERREISSSVLRPIAGFRKVGAITGIPSLKNESRDYFVQGLERLTRGLRGESYCFVVVAQPVREVQVDDVIQRCRDLGSEIHAFVRGTMTDTVGQTVSRTSQRGGSLGGGLIMGAGSLLGTMLGFGPMMSMAAPALQAVVGGAGFSLGRADTEADQRMRGASREVLNKTAGFCEELLDRYVERLQAGKNLGFWSVGSFFLADDDNVLHRGQGVIRALLSGEETYFEPMRALDLSSHDEVVRDALMQFRSPEIDLPPEAPHPLGPLYHAMATPMNTAELSLVMSLPREEIPGVSLTPMADFGINPPAMDGYPLGQVMHRGENLAASFSVPAKSLTKHVFVTGITGSGKTNTCLALLRAAYEKEKVPFLVIEPAKTEYRSLLADPVLGPEMQVFTLGDETLSPLRLNPFAFAPGYPLLTHIDLLKAVFNSSFPMYASMPYILEEALIDIYLERGWDLARSTNRFLAAGEDYTPYLPTLEDLYGQIDVVVERKRYALQLSMDISAALKARLQSLLIGGKGLMLNTRLSYPLHELFGKPAVMELKNIGDDSEKAFLMALLLINLYEYCETAREYGGGLQHVTLIEEAHRLLKNIPPALSSESANPRGKAVEMFTDILAEIREYGEGFIIVDQVPAKLAPDALKNTNLKILHRIVAEDDRQSVGNAMNLTSEQKEQVVRLRVGQAIVHNEYLDRPMLIQVHAVKDQLRQHFGETMGPAALRERMAAFGRRMPEIHRRWPACAGCDAPCTYLSDQNRPDKAALETFDRFLQTMLLSSPREVRRIWGQSDAVLREGLRTRFFGEELTPGLVFCHRTQAIHLSLKEYYAYYAGGRGGFRSLIRLEESLSDLCAGLTQEGPLSEVVAEAADAFLGELRSAVALEPCRREPGCRYCRRPCWYGYLVQRDLAPKAKALAGRLKAAAAEPDFANNYRRLVEVVSAFARDVSPASVAESHLGHLAYCYLVNTGGAHPHVLRGFGEQLVLEAGGKR